MQTYVKVNGKIKNRTDLELIEQDTRRVYMETREDNNIFKINNGKLIKVKDCKNIGFTDFDRDEVSEIDRKRLSEPIEHSVHLKNVQTAEQDNKYIHIIFKDGHKLSVKGNLDRAYDD